MELFCILFAVMLKQIYTYVQIHKIVLGSWFLPYVNLNIYYITFQERLYVNEHTVLNICMQLDIIFPMIHLLIHAPIQQMFPNFITDRITLNLLFSPSCFHFLKDEWGLKQKFYL